MNPFSYTRATVRLVAAGLILGWLSPDAVAQQAPLSLGSSRPAGEITVGSAYQRIVDGGRTLNETSIPVSVFIPAGRSLSFSLLGYGASAGGRDLAALRGVTDVLAGARYAREVGSASVVASVSANLPLGPSLSEEEFETSLWVGQTPYGFDVPTLSQGFKLSPSLTIAVPLADGIVVGAGAGYQMRGSYKPVADFEESSEPGDEILLTTGLDIRLGAAAVVSADLSMAFYGRDRVEGEEVYRAGRTLLGAARLRLYPGRDEMKLFIRFRKRSGGSLILDGVAVPVAEQAVPDHFEARWRFDSQVRSMVRMGVLIGVRHFTRSEYSRALSVVDAGLAPAVALTPSVSLNGRFLYTIGSFTGLNLGTGFTVTF